jgi:hypothetical protein
MTMQVVIQVSGQPDVVIGVTDAAMRRARVSFNPSSLPHVDNIKALTAALYTEIAPIPDVIEGKLVEEAGARAAIPSAPVEAARREAATAATHLQAAAMFAVSAATAHLVK